jgi:hypothetical protein
MRARAGAPQGEQGTWGPSESYRKGVSRSACGQVGLGDSDPLAPSVLGTVSGLGLTGCPRTQGVYVTPWNMEVADRHMGGQRLGETCGDSRVPGHLS